MSKPATVAQSGNVRLPVRRTGTLEPRVDSSHPIARHRFTVGDRLTIMDFGRNAYDKVTVTAVDGRWITFHEETDGWERGCDTSLLSVLAGQAAAHHGRTSETPGVGVIYTAEGGAHGITDGGVCVICCHNR